jgi:uncharacterized protein YjiS (DUF1127 family)
MMSSTPSIDPRHNAILTVAKFSRSRRQRRANASAFTEATLHDGAAPLTMMDDTLEEMTMTTVSLFVTQEPSDGVYEWPAPRVIEARQPEPPAPQPRLSLSRRIASWIERVRQRDALANLDDRMLRDIGLTRYDVAAETGKPFWR